MGKKDRKRRKRPAKSGGSGLGCFLVHQLQTSDALLCNHHFLQVREAVPHPFTLDQELPLQFFDLEFSLPPLADLRGQFC